MVIVQLSGGLGNQMFEYALYLRLKADGRQVKIDDSTCYGHEGERPLQLGRVFGAVYDRASEEELRRMTDSFPDLPSRIRRKLFGRKNLSYRESGVNFDPEVLRREPALLEGCFQSERYFAPAAARVREAYRFRPEALSFSERSVRLERQLRRQSIRRSASMCAEEIIWIPPTAEYIRAFVRRIIMKGPCGGYGRSWRMLFSMCFPMIRTGRGRILTKKAAWCRKAALRLQDMKTCI